MTGTTGRAPAVDRREQMFPKLTAAQIARLRPFGHERQCQSGEVLFEQGQGGVPFFVILEGALEVVHPQRGPSEGTSPSASGSPSAHHSNEDDIITVHHPSEFTGETALLSGRRSLVLGRARTACHVLVVERAALRSLVQSNAELSEMKTALQAP